jgi:hypothetical protein
MRANALKVAVAWQPVLSFRLQWWSRHGLLCWQIQPAARLGQWPTHEQRAGQEARRHRTTPAGFKCGAALLSRHCWWGGRQLVHGSDLYIPGRRPSQAALARQLAHLPPSRRGPGARLLRERGQCAMTRQPVNVASMPDTYVRAKHSKHVQFPTHPRTTQHAHFGFASSSRACGQHTCTTHIDI